MICLMLFMLMVLRMVFLGINCWFVFATLFCYSLVSFPYEVYFV